MPALDIRQPLATVAPDSASDWDKNNNIIIIGSGIAGLAAASTLHYLNVPFQILEASTIHGGRVRRNNEFLNVMTTTDETNVPVPIDIGAEWIHTHPSVLKDLLVWPEDMEEVNSWIEQDIIEYIPQTWGYWNFGKLNRKDYIKDEYKEYKFKQKSWSQYVDHFFLRHVKSYIEYGAIVKKIDYSSEKNIRVTIENGTEYVCHKVICAVPLSILKDGQIQFVPDLDNGKKRVLQNTSMPPGLKVAIEFKTKFFLDASYDHGLWNNQFKYIFGAGADRMYFDALLGKGLDNKHVMGVYMYGDSQAGEVANKSDDEIFQFVMKKLDMMYDGQATKNYVKHIVQNWTREPFIMGGFSSGWHDDAVKDNFVNKPLSDKVYFAGEHTAGYLAHSVHGAALSGRRAAIHAITNVLYKF